MKQKLQHIVGACLILTMYIGALCVTYKVSYSIGYNEARMDARIERIGR